MNRARRKDTTPHNRHPLFMAGVLALLLLAACQGQGEGTTRNTWSSGSPENGRRLIQMYGCGSCHVIPGVPGADSLVGPPLTDWARRHYIAGHLNNTVENLVFWIQFPQAVEPGTVMPDLGVTRQEAHDISAYLYTLGDDR